MYKRVDGESERNCTREFDRKVKLQLSNGYNLRDEKKRNFWQLNRYFVTYRMLLRQI